MEQVGGHAVAFLVIGGAIEIPGGIALCKSHQPCQGLTLELSYQQDAGIPRAEEIIGALVICQAVHAKGIPFACCQAHAVKGCHILAGADDHALTFRQADVIARLGFHLHQQIIVWALQIDHDRARRLDGVSGWGKTGQLSFDKVWFNRLPNIRLDAQKEGALLSAQHIHGWPEVCPIPIANRAARDIGDAQP